MLTKYPTMTDPTVAPIPSPALTPTWVPRGYHVLTHANTDAVMLGTNAVPKVGVDATFAREGQALRWRADPQSQEGWSFDDVPADVWSAIEEGRCFLVEFGPLGPITEHDVVIAAPMA